MKYNGYGKLFAATSLFNKADCIYFIVAVILCSMSCWEILLKSRMFLELLKVTQ